MYEFEVFDDLHSSLVSTTKTKNVSEDAHESSFDSDSTIIETDIDLESIANKYIRDAESTTNNKLNKISLDKEICNFTKSKSDPELKIQIDSNPEIINKLTNSAASSIISSTSNSTVNSSRSSSFSNFFANKESDPELDFILKKYSNFTSSTNDTNTNSSLKRTALSTLSRNINTNSTTSVSNTNTSSLKRTASSTLSRNINEEPIELSSDDDLPQIQVKTVQSPTVKSYMSEFNFDDTDDENLWNKYKIPNDEPCTSSGLQSLKNPEKDPVQDDLISCNSPKKRRKVNPDKADKEKRKIERAAQQAKKREETERAKKLKQALSAANKNMKPEECMKFITVFLDTDIANEKYGGEILNALQTADVAYRLQSQLIPHTVTWNRKVQKHVDDNGELIEISETVETSEVLLIINWDKIVDLVHTQSLRTHVESVKSTLMNKKISLAIYGLDNYFKYQKNQKQKDMRSEIAETSQKSKSKFDKIYKNAQKINKKQLEMALTELQVLCSCCYRKVDTPQDIGAMIAQYTKTIAQAPYKLEKHQKQQEAEWYMCGDNKDCVSVDKNGNGLQRLWQQQLTTFPLARLEHAEAIAAQYSTPLNLMKEYQQISPEQGEKLLKDIPIRRAAGPLTTVRKIGPELSKKIYTFFTSKNGDVLL